MSWDDAPPDQDLTRSGGWDSAPPDTDLQPPRTLEGFLGNAVSNAGRMINPLKMVEGFGSTLKEGLYDIPKAAAESSVDVLKEAAKAATGGGLPSREEVEKTPILQKTREMVEPIAKDPIGYAYKNPLDAAALVAAPLTALLPETSEAAAEIPKEPVIPPAAEGGGGLHVIEPEAETATPTNSLAQRLAARTTSQALDISPLAARKLATKAGVSPEQAILDLGQKANELIPNLVEPLDSANTKFAKILDAHDAAGKEIGAIVDNATKGTQGAFPEANETIGALRTAAENYYQVDGGDLALQKTADRLENLQKTGKLDFDRLSQVKSAIGKGFNKTEAPPGTEEIYSILNDGIDKVINRLAKENPSLGADFSHLKQVYTVTSRLLPAMSRTAAREVSGASMGGGLLSKVIPSAIGGALGGPGGAALGAGAKWLQEAVAPDLGKNLAFMAMKGTPKLLGAVKKAFPALSETEAVGVVKRLEEENSKLSMSRGGVVPDDVKQWVDSRTC